MRTQNEILREQWESQRETLTREMAETKISVRLYSNLPPEEEIGERQLGEFGGAKGVAKVTAKEALEASEKALTRVQRILTAIEQLLGELPAKSE